jgi:hypothetical protein
MNIGTEPESLVTSKDESITFKFGGINLLTVTPRGFFVEGVLVKEGEDVYEALIKWLKKANEKKI